MFRKQREKLKYTIRLGLALFSLTLAPQVLGGDQWVNAIGNQECFPDCIPEPKSLEEVRESVRVAAFEGFRVRAIGNGYSISAIGCTDGYLLNMKYLNSILSVDTNTQTVRVEAGISMKALNSQLAGYNLALSNQAAITEISLGGALSTGVHGTGHTGTLSSFVKEIELVIADGRVLTLSQECDSEAFAAARIGLGSLGVIYAVTLQCEPLFHLTASSQVMDIDSVLSSYKQLHGANDFFQFSWNVAAGSALVNHWNRHEDTAEAAACYDVLPWYVIEQNDRDLFSEIAIPIDLLPAALQAIKPFVENCKLCGARLADLSIRFIEQDDSVYLSPAFDGPVACIALCILEEDKYLLFYEEFEEMMRPFAGRPHWGKLNFLTYERALASYGANLLKFIEVKRRLDPQGIFSNEFTDRIMNPD